MLSQENIEKINRQISTLLDELSVCSSYRRPQILQKIEDLRALAEPPQAEIDYDELADALVRKLRPEPKEPETFGELLNSLFGGNR